MTETVAGPVDNYLSAEEKAYFETGGKNEAAIDYTEGGEPISAPAPDSEIVSDDDTGQTNGPQNVDPGVSDDGEDSEATESEDDDTPEDTTQNKRDYEKAFKTERHKRKELKEALDAQAREASEMKATLEHLKQTMLTRQEPQKAPEPQEVVPDPNEDPIGYQQYKIDKLERTQAQLNKYLSEQYQSNQRTQAQQAFVQTYKAAADEFAKKTPDFMDAYNYVVKGRTEEFMAAGYTKAEADAMVVEDEMAIASRAYQDKVNPAERVYKLAQARGYTGQKAPAKAAPKNLESIKNGMKNAKSLKAGGGELGEKTLGLPDVDSMDFREFDEFWAGFKAKAKGR